MSNIEDQFMRLLELMARALGAYLNKLIGLKQISPEQARLFSNECLKGELNLSVKALSEIDNKALIELLSEKKYNNNHIELLAQFIFETADIVEDKNESQLLYHKAKFLLEYVSERDKTFSVERNKQLKKIDKILLSHKLID